MCSLHLTHPSAHRLDAAVPGEQLGVQCLAQESHFSCRQFLPEPRFEPTTSGHKSNALSIRPQLLLQDKVYLLYMLYIYIYIYIYMCVCIYIYICVYIYIYIYIYTHTHTHTHTHVGFYGLRGLSIGVMVFILYKLYVLLPYTYPTPKLSPHRRRCIYIFPQKNSLCMIYKRFKLWGHWKCPHKSPSPCNTYVIPMSLYKFVSS